MISADCRGSSSWCHKCLRGPYRWMPYSSISPLWQLTLRQLSTFRGLQRIDYQHHPIVHPPDTLLGNVSKSKWIVVTTINYPTEAMHMLANLEVNFKPQSGKKSGGCWEHKKPIPPLRWFVWKYIGAALKMHCCLSWTAWLFAFNVLAYDSSVGSLTASLRTVVWV